MFSRRLVFSPIGLLSLLWGFLLVFSYAQAEFKVPRLSGAVVDGAGLLASRDRQALDSALRQFRGSGGAQIAVLTVNDLGGIPIEQAAIQVVDKWQLGDKKTDDGVLFLISKGDRKARIEVGQGMEGNLPDAYAKQIIEDAVIPLFRQGEFSQGILLGVFQIAKRTNPKISFAGNNQQQENWQRRPKQKISLFKLLIYGFFIMILLFTRGGRWFLLGMLLSGGRGRGGFGGGGGGGGFSGGGGGFSGGGASGRW